MTPSPTPSNFGNDMRDRGLVERAGAAILIGAIALAGAGTLRIFLFPPQADLAGGGGSGPTHHGAIVVGTGDSFDGE